VRRPTNRPGKVRNSIITLLQNGPLAAGPLFALQHQYRKLCCIAMTAFCGEA
jgi:hypothetical protein